jgi:hypothetical protein
MIEKIEIPISKQKIFIVLFGVLILFVGGICLVLKPETFGNNIIGIRNPENIRFFGIAGIIFFGAALIYGISKLFDNKPGLIIDENGISDNSNASSVGLINWSDIVEIKAEQVMSTKFLLIYVKNSEEYITKTKSALKRKLLQANMNKYGTPISIIYNTLSWDFAKVEKLIRKTKSQWDTIN